MNPRNRAAPVTITKPDGSSFEASARDFRSRPAEAAEEQDVPPEALTPEGAVTIEAVEEWVQRTLVLVMRNSVKLSERTAAATAAIKYLGIKYRVGPAFGEELDD